MKQIKIHTHSKFRRKFFTINAHSDEHISSVLESTETFYEIGILEFCKALVPRCRNVVDVGANIGNHSIYWAAICHAQVNAYEPFSSNFQLLEKNIIANGLAGSVVPHNIALGAVPGVAQLEVVEPGNMGMVAVKSQRDYSFKSDEENTVTVRTLDQCVADLMPKYIDLLKIDTEGYEKNVLLGGLDTLRDYQPFIWVEIWADEDYLAIKDLLETVGYVWSARYRSSHNYFFSKVSHSLFFAKLQRKSKSVISKGRLMLPARRSSDTW